MAARRSRRQPVQLECQESCSVAQIHGSPPTKRLFYPNNTGNRRLKNRWKGVACYAKGAARVHRSFCEAAWILRSLRRKWKRLPSRFHFDGLRTNLRCKVRVISFIEPASLIRSGPDERCRLSFLAPNDLVASVRRPPGVIFAS